ncbi:ATP-binding cassette domain-containing protein [Schleiferilactobacillus harbinensis]|uniref:ATP-binding cassette domain-containing protein n=1 Tax=Schleiferilactobacillus harbinensis TaxID=304207 RepID=UPI00243210F0|nr:ABC transporter ATP-binding protein [Schleiferilactobacillus harbinensis]MCI1687801.1 ABC transporter ATP-binding protein/permease [Schleiferilactobacillus harbinensis]MCI1783071.1 ABC transporter ATP-binding protein/permease [Schleiferilactobacillus harbinensis]MCI1851675.1 ABC transporter ATP-binding protein/permease [Schleiferilactobacillus harbinensis]
MDKHLRHYLWEFKGPNSLLVIIVLFMAVMQTANGIGSANALTALVAGQFPKFFLWVGLMTAAYALYCGLMGVQQYQFSRCRQLMNTAIRRDITARLSDTSYEVFHSQSSAVYASWLTNDVHTIGVNGFYDALEIVESSFSVIFAAAALTAYHYSLSIAVLVLAVVVYLVPKAFDTSLQAHSLAMIHANERLMGRISDVLSGFDALNLLSLRKLLVKRTVAASNDVAVHVNSWQKMYGITNATIWGTSAICQNLVLLLTGYLVWQHLVPVGTVNASMNFAGLIFSGLTSVMSSYMDMKSIIPIFNKFDQVPVRDTAGLEKVAPFATALQMHDITFAYSEESQPILQNFSLTVAKNKKYALIGPSGSGKSTVLNLLIGNLTNYTGTLLYDTTNYRQILPDSLIAQVTYLDQTPFMFNDTLKNNLTMGEPYSDTAVATVIQRVGLAKMVADLPGGLTTMVEKDGHNLSGGQKQRIVLARGLLQGRQIVFMDESTASLDPLSAQAIEEMIVTDPHLTVVMVTHHLRPVIADQMDQVINSTVFTTTHSVK